MTVAQLIATLQNYPQDAVVVVDCPDGFCEVMPRPTLYRTGVPYSSQFNNDTVSLTVEPKGPVLVLQVADP